MNNAYKEMLKRERRSQLVAQAIGWVVIGFGAMVCHGVWYGWLLYCIVPDASYNWWHIITGVWYYV
jgi:hypothetical protein